MIRTIGWLLLAISLTASAFGQTPTKVRSVASLPAACFGGNALQSSDEVILVSAGVGSLYWCAATNIWVQAANNGGATSFKAQGTAALGTGAINSGTCAAAVTTSATGVLTTDVVKYSFNSDPTGVTGYAPSVSGMLTIIPYPTADNVNVKVCNNTAASVTPGAVTLNWQVIR